jgi:hypothetical protein
MRWNMREGYPITKGPNKSSFSAELADDLFSRWAKRSIRSSSAAPKLAS